MAINGSRKIRIRQKQSKVKPYTARSDTGWWNHILLFPMATDGKSCSCISDRSLYAGGWLQAVYSYTVVPSSKTQYSHTGQKRSRLSTVITPPGGVSIVQMIHWRSLCCQYLTSWSPTEDISLSPHFIKDCCWFATTVQNSCAYKGGLYTL